MRTLLPLAVLIVALFLAAPAQAQLRAEAPQRIAPVAVYESNASTGLGLQNLFNAETMRLSHSYEFSTGSVGGDVMSLGVLSTTVGWQPTDRLAARVSVGVAHSPFGTDRMQSAMGFSQDQPARVFIQDATLAYRPTENSVLTFSFSQSPYGNYASPFGHGYAPYGHSPFQQARFRAASANHDALFWRGQ